MARPSTRSRRPRWFEAPSIATRLLVFAIILVSAPALLVGTLSYTRARRAHERAARPRLPLLARDVGADVHRELEDRLADTTTWTPLEIMRGIHHPDVDKELAQFFR